MKTKITMLCVMLLSLFIQTSAKAQKILLRADLAVTNLTVTSVNGNSFTFNYTVQNVGNASLELSRLLFQTYVSTNSVYDATDLPAGGAIFGNTAPILTPGATYSGSWTSSNAAGISTYHYLIYEVKLRSGYVSQETNLANNTLAQDVAPSFADLVVSNITVNSINGNTLSYTYTISNNGASTLYLDRFYFQAYVSQNSVYDGTDVAAGGSIFGSAPLTLAPGATFTGSWSNNPGVSLQTYPYLIFDVRLLSGQVHPQLSVANDRYVKYLLSSFADLVVSDITVTNITGNNVAYTYTISNNGASTLYLDRFYFQAYVSQNSVYDGTDVPAGGSIFGNAPLTLAPGATFTGSWSDDPGVSIEIYPYLIFDVRLLSGQVHPQISLTNDRYVKYLPYSFTDLVVTNIATNTFNPTTSVNFTYTVSNGGQTALQLNQFYFQTYLSTNNVYDNLDKPAGGSVFPTNTILATGSTYSGSWTSSAGVSIQSYPYLIFIVKTVSGAVVHEVSYTNNQYIKYIPLVFSGFEKSLTKSAEFKVEKSDELLTLENGVDIEEQTSYILYSIAGEKITEGSFNEKKEINTSSLKNGIYILHLNNGSTNESVKFVVQK
ncbi:MAG: hypothetical protein JWM14_303 [Chitinophagaceae bacterium]|nr:hypothetical protein [Chitinophagaceae bacterium]